MTSALFRPLIFSCRSNRMSAAGFFIGLLAGRKLGGTWASGLECAAGTFISWSLTRELDPDHQKSSEVAVVLGLLTQSVLAAQTRTEPNNALNAANTAVNLGAQLSSLRLLLASVGPAPTTADLTQMAASAALNARAGQPVAALMPALSLGLSGTLNDRHTADNSWQAAGAALLASAVPARQRNTDSRRKRHILSDVLSLAALGLGYGLTRPEPVTSHCDEGRARVSAQRLQATRALAVASVGTLLLRGESKQGLPLALACTVVGLRRLK